MKPDNFEEHVREQQSEFETKVELSVRVFERLDAINPMDLEEGSIPTLLVVDEMRNLSDNPPNASSLLSTALFTGLYTSEREARHMTWRALEDGLLEMSVDRSILVSELGSELLQHIESR